MEVNDGARYLSYGDGLGSSCWDSINGDGLESSNHIIINLNPQESGPFGLSLRKSTSLSELIETTLNQQNQPKINRQLTSEKLKASNFSATYLQIGSWNWVSKNEGDLVAKIYYAKKKLVWELLFGSFKRKMEISWSEISALNAFISQGQNGLLEIELNKPPQFSQELNSQPRKHTQWTTAEDFTGQQALICRRHRIGFLPGVLDAHLEKLLQCDSRLLRLSRQPFPLHNSAFIIPGTFLNFSHKQSGVGCSSVVPPLVIEEQDHLIPYHGSESMILDQHGELNLYDDVENVIKFSKEQSWCEADSTFKPFDHQQMADSNYHDYNSDHGGSGMNKCEYINYDDANQQWW